MSYDERLYGKDPEENIVAINLIRDDQSEGTAYVRIFSRDGDEVTYRDEEMTPFVLVNDPEVLFGVPSDYYSIYELEGDQNFKYLAVFSNYIDKRNALLKIRQQSWSKGSHHYDKVYYLRRPEFDYMTHSGKTLFKGMNFDDLHRMQLDIEVITSTHANFPNADVDGDEIMIIALSDNKGWELVIHTSEQYNPEYGEYCESEGDLIYRLLEIIEEKNPDVIEGHNILSFDFPYIFTRAERYGIEMTIGRDGSVPRQYNSSQRFAERTVEFVDYEIIGRYVIDTYLQVMAFDVFSRSLPGYGLKVVAKYFGYAKEDRVYVEGGDITPTWYEDPKKILDYALDDVYETRRIAEHLGKSTFYLSKMLPMPYDRVSRSGPAQKIEALFVRWYLKNYHSIRAQMRGHMTVGGYTDVFFTGVFGPIVYADVESLYPAIMLNNEVIPEGDDLDIFQQLLQLLTNLRFEAKHARNEHDEDSQEYSELDALQSSYKILINSFYGMLGFANAAFNDFYQADRVTQTGQDTLRSLIKAIEDDGGIVIEADTDGVLFIPPPGVTTGAEIPEDAELPDWKYVKSLTERMSEGIKVGFDGRAYKMFSYKRKNYAILSYDGKLKVKGSSLVSRSIERFGREFVEGIIRLMLTGDVKGMHDLYMYYYNRIINREMEPQEFIRRETLKDSVETYTRKIRARERNQAASYELAIERYNDGGPMPRKGDRIHYYVTGTNKNPRVFENAKLEENYNRDENSAFYLRRLNEFAAKFEQFFTPLEFKMIFGPETLYNFDFDQVVIISEKVEKEVEDKEESVPF